MKKVIKTFEKFKESYQDEIYALYQNGELERASFPFKGEIADGVIFEDEEATYLIPVSTIKASHMSSSDDDEDDRDVDDNDTDLDTDLDVVDDSEDIEDDEE